MSTYRMLLNKSAVPDAVVVVVVLEAVTVAELPALVAAVTAPANVFEAAEMLESVVALSQFAFSFGFLLAGSSWLIGVVHDVTRSLERFLTIILPAGRMTPRFALAGGSCSCSHFSLISVPALRIQKVKSIMPSLCVGAIAYSVFERICHRSRREN